MSQTTVGRLATFSITRELFAEAIARIVVERCSASHDDVVNPLPIDAKVVRADLDLSIPGDEDIIVHIESDSYPPAETRWKAEHIEIPSFKAVQA